MSDSLSNTQKLQFSSSSQDEGNGVPQDTSMQDGPAHNPQHKDQTDVLNNLYPSEHAVTQTESTMTDTTSDTTINSAKPRRRIRFLPKTWHKVVFALFLLIIVAGAALVSAGMYTMTVAGLLKLQTDELQTHAREAYDQFKAQNLPGVEERMGKVKEKLQTIRNTYSQLSFYQNFPFAATYYQDGIHGLNAADHGVEAVNKALAEIIPHADVLGFKGEGSYTGGGTAEDRLKVILQTLEKISPKIDGIAQELDMVKAELAHINPSRYPENFQGRPLRMYLQKAQEVSNGAATTLTEFRPVLERLNYIAGGDGKRKKYLVIFQNDNELRPTGGFLTAYAVIYVENGKVSLEKSDDIYEMDKKFTKKLPIPEKLGKYLTTESKWNLRDMNTSPDFKISMDQFLENYKTLKSEPQDINGIIAIDTHVLTELVKVLGPVDVPGYGQFTAENTPKCDCPQIIHAMSEIITRPTPYIRPDRKGMLGPMARAILDKAYTAPKTMWPQLFEAGWKSIQGRHAQAYFFDEKSQHAAEVISAGGRMLKDQNAQDFLAIVNANLGGAKSNLFVNYEVAQEVSAPKNGQITKKVTITYRNSRKGDNCNLEAGLLCLNSTLRDWTRLYLPQGAKMVNAEGFRAGTAKQYDEGEFTVIDGEMILEPLSQTKVVVEYTVPYTDQDEYKVKLWKQGGVSPIPTKMDVNGEAADIVLDKDTVFTSKFN